ncbi:hypothetical protein V1522DRAFT_393781 [Lipomyces starkeyi]
MIVHTDGFPTSARSHEDTTCPPRIYLYCPTVHDLDSGARQHDLPDTAVQADVNVNADFALAAHFNALSHEEAQTVSAAVFLEGQKGSQGACSTADSQILKTIAIIRVRIWRIPSAASGWRTLRNHWSKEVEYWKLCKSRLVGDIWHVMDWLPLSKIHGIHKIFARVYETQFYFPDDEDRIATYLLQTGIRDLGGTVTNQPEVDLGTCERVFIAFGGISCASGKKALFHHRDWHMHEARLILEEVRKGTDVYYSIESNFNGLPRIDLFTSETFQK